MIDGKTFAKLLFDVPPPPAYKGIMDGGISNYPNGGKRYKVKGIHQIFTRQEIIEAFDAAQAKSGLKDDNTIRMMLAVWAVESHYCHQAANILGVYPHITSTALGLGQVTLKLAAGMGVNSTYWKQNFKSSLSYNMYVSMLAWQVHTKSAYSIIPDCAGWMVYIDYWQGGGFFKTMRNKGLDYAITTLRNATPAQFKAQLNKLKGFYDHVIKHI